MRIGEGKYTYYNRRGKQAFDAVFGAAGDFAENLAPVKSEGKWGFINASGEFVIQPAYQQAVPSAGAMPQSWTTRASGASSTPLAQPS